MILRGDSRRIRLNTALGPDALGVRHARMVEALGQPFELTITALVGDPAADLDALIGRNLTLSFATRSQDAPRHWNAFVSRARLVATRRDDLTVQITAAPWLWFLSLSKNCRIYEEKTTPEIIESVLQDHGFGDYALQLNRDYPEHIYCVQYNESDFDFIQRLMEHAGIYYYFEHQNGAHKLVIVDSMDALAPYPGYEDFIFVEAAAREDDRGEVLRAWMPERAVRPTAFAHTAYDFANPGADLGADSQIARAHGLSNMAVFEWPDHYETAGDGEFYARTRIEALQASHARAHAEANLRGVEAGRRFTLLNAPLKGEEGRKAEGEHVVISAEHSLEATGFRSGDGGEERFASSFVAMPASESFRLPRATEKPRIPGPQTAMVTGSEGEEIDPDAHGRVKVTFHWLLGHPSCWVRVAQPWAGSGFGAMAIPRIGDEVVVAFEDGDPDRPLIVGSVYNAASRFPYPPPEHRTVTAVKTNSSPDGGGFNELRFDDKAGDENVFLHAQKDHDLRVRNVKRSYIGNELHETVEKKAFRQIGEERHETIGQISHESIGDMRHLEVGGDMFRAVGGASHLDVGGDGFESVGGALHVDAGSNILLASGANTVASAGADTHIKAGANVVIEAGAQITLKTSSGDFITVGPAGVFIKGSMVFINSGGAAGAGPGTKPTAATIAEKPKEPDKAHVAKPGKVAAPPGERPRALTPQEIDSHPTAAALRRAQSSGAPFCEECAKAAEARG